MNFPDLSIKQLLTNNRYSVPRYQRNYAWTEEHIKQLIDDVLDNANQSGDLILPYYLGTLVVFPIQQGNNLLYEVIDGQQRLTTLTLLASYITYTERSESDPSSHWFEEINLDFQSRKRSVETLAAAHNGSFHDTTKKINLREEHSAEIVEAYKIIQRLLPERCREQGIDETQFAKYFLENVKICRVTVPDDTDLNHYFEIMNSRGEQLEKHEVVKARLLNKLPLLQDQFIFNKIWEACSDLDKYIQYSFEKSSREKLFGKTWDQFLPEHSDNLFALMATNDNDPKPTNDNNPNPANENKDLLSNLILHSLTISNHDVKKEKEEEPERFSSIINFQNFLPHVLSIFLKTGDIPLDDKPLLESFKRLEALGSAEIKRFGFALLKIRFLFDQSIIKRDATEDEREWSLKMLHQTEQGNPSYRHSFTKGQEGNDLQQQITLLQSMFHVSVPSRPYKYWLQGTLKFLYETKDIKANEFRDYLKGLANAFVYNRFLASGPLRYEEIIFSNLGKSIPQSLNVVKTQYGQIENILVFNFIDFLLWEQHNAGEKKDEKIGEFVYTFRSSIEHYYPQNPIDGNPLSDKEVLHSIGNLCLISHSKNSILRHHLPRAKAEYYLRQQYIDSILQYQMLEQADEWSIDPVKSIQHQEKQIVDLLKKNNS